MAENKWSFLGLFHPAYWSWHFTLSYWFLGPPCSWLFQLHVEARNCMQHHGTIQSRGANKMTSARRCHKPIFVGNLDFLRWSHLWVGPVAGAMRCVCVCSLNVCPKLENMEKGRGIIPLTLEFRDHKSDYFILYWCRRSFWEFHHPTNKILVLIQHPGFKLEQHPGFAKIKFRFNRYGLWCFPLPGCNRHHQDGNAFWGLEIPT